MRNLFFWLFSTLLGLSTANAQVKEYIFNGDTTRQVPALVDLDEGELGLLMTLPPVPVPQIYQSNPPELPYAVNNSLLPFFRPAYNQDGLSCGQAAMVGYNFTYEINRVRNLPGNVTANQYPTHFAWNWVNGGQAWYGASYFHSLDLLRHVGTPNVVTYGGMSAGGGSRWMSGYDNYYQAMQNRIYDAYSIDVSTIQGLQILKHHLHDHLEGSPYGGVVSFYANPPALYNLPAGTPEAGKKVVIGWSSANHAMTFLGYNDSIRWDFNGDGQYTNHLDINSDGKVDLRDWEIGGVIMVNSYGGVPNWGDGGFAYVMYKTLAEPYGGGGIWNNAVHLLKPKQSTSPKLTMKVKIKHTSRNKIKITAGVSPDPNATSPAIEMDFPMIHYQGDHMYMQGGSSDADKTIEVGLDISSLLSVIESGQEARYFFRVYETDPNNMGSGEITAFSLMNYTSGLQEIVCPGLPTPIIENGKTTVWVNAIINYNPVVITTDNLPPAKTYEPYSYQLQATGGDAPYHWYMKMDYPESIETVTFPNVTQQQLSVTNNTSGYATKILDFAFPYYGKYFDTLYIRVDGLIMFDKQLYPWPYLNEPWVLFKGYRNISPFNANLKINSGQGIWYEGSQEYAIFRWKVSMESSSSNELNFAVKLYPSGKIEYYYGSMNIPANTEWIGGLASGDYRNQHYLSFNNSATIPANTKVNYQAPDFAPEMTVTPDGLVTGMPTNEYQNAQLKFMAVDNNDLFTTKTLAFSTRGFRTYYTINSGGDNIIEFGESALMGLTIVSMEPETLHNLTISLASDDPFINIISSTINVFQINPGDSIIFSNAFAFSVSSSIPDNHLINFNLIIATTEDTWTRQISLRGFAPKVKPISINILDNHNGILDPGEVADLAILIKNNGGALVNNLNISLSTTHPDITVTQGNFVFDTLSAGATKTALFSIIASNSLSPGQVIVFTLNITGHNQYSTTEQINVIAGLVVENFESGSFNAFNWQHAGDKAWLIDNLDAWEGNFCARSGTIDHSQSSVMQISLVVTANDTISFYRKVSSESGYDFLRFHINSTQAAQWSGEAGWARVKFPVTPGTHTFKWTYVKDNSMVGGMDCGMVDYIVFPPLLAVFAGQDQTLCEGEAVELNGNASNYTSLVWTTSGTGTFSDPGIPAPFYTPSQADISTGNVILTLTAYSQVAGANLTDQVTIYFDPLPLAASAIAGPNSVNLELTLQSIFEVAVIPNADWYEWIIEPADAGVVNGFDNITTIDWNPEFLGEVTVRVKAWNDCGAGPVSAPMNVLVFRSGVGIGFIEVQDSPKIQPNPNNGLFTLNLPQNYEVPYALQLMNAQGELLLNLGVVNERYQVISIPGSQKGIFVLMVTSRQRTVNMKIVVY